MTKDFTRREFLRIGAFGAASTALGMSLPGSLLAANEGHKPNIVVILSDDQGYAELGCQGSKQIPTPNIDSIATNGIRFTSGYVSAPVCSPSRAGLMTGRYQQRFGHEFNAMSEGTDENPIGLPLTEVTLADRLKAAGYATGLVGKWHLGFKPQFMPTKRGFDEFFGFVAAAHSYTDPLKGTWNPIYRGTEQVDEKEHLTDAFAREARSFIGRHAEHPFFLYLAFNAIHTPLQPKEEYMKRFEGVMPEKRRKFCALTAQLDDAVGSVLAELKKNKLEENTLIFFLSDNGGPTFYTTSSNLPLKGEKSEVWEGGIRVPFMAQWKGKLPVGNLYNEPISTLDISATALSLAGVTPLAQNKLDGVDLMPYLTGKNGSAPHKELYWRYGKQRAIRQGNYKLIWPDTDTPRLYDLSKDIGEKNDIAPQHPEKVKELQSLYEKWNAQLVAPKWGKQDEPPVKAE